MREFSCDTNACISVKTGRKSLSSLLADSLLLLMSMSFHCMGSSSLS